MPARQARRRRRGSVTALVALILGVIGLGASLVGVAVQLLPRQFTAAQQQKIMAWEVGKRWRVLPAKSIFPASIQYRPPSVLEDGTALTLSAQRIGIAPQSVCSAAADRPVALLLTRYGCQALLRATYVDDTDTYVLTVGVAVLPGQAQAGQVERSLTEPRLTDARGAPAAAAGVRAVSFKGTSAAGFTDSRRQISASVMKGPYVVMYTVGYTDGRPWVPVAADSYADAEMTSMAQGVAGSVATVLGAPPRVPHCPGAPGC
jgi:hypothetical protein